ncbi:putative nucleotidyltransferase substrate binding domain-containing protein [Thalassotalea sp. PLHSN55]|uniref:putative nucleotidyltransferase substrate binding domain-containing protein n=1 Tax=Thalassotalea sp. PLHSN55 TaxID=3435888 RepID=UPI003F837E2C
MDTALSEICAFIEAIPPFDLLDNQTLENVIKEIDICYLRNQNNLPPDEYAAETLFILRKGALSYYSSEEELLGMYGEGDICTIYCHKQNTTNIQVRTHEDTLLYAIPYPALQEILKDSPDVIGFFENSAEQRLQKKMATVNEEAIIASSLMNTSIADFYHTPVASINHKCTIQDAAIKMTELGYSCLMVLDGDITVGIVTDKDIRRRCVAAGLAISEPITTIITDNLTTIDVKSSAYEALMIMTSKHIHHLPVTDQGQLAGMVTVTDLMNHEGQNAVNLTSIIHKANSVSELAEISKMLPKLQIRMAKLGTTADHVGKSISAITMAFTIRLIEMAEKLLGPAPVPYAWLAAGSQARQEQFAHSDQDNALIISNDMKAEDNYWFFDLATFVSDGLAACGFIYCPGDIMATNTKWRQPQKVWSRYFDKWVDTPSPKALLNSSVFFDLTTVHGDASLLESVRQQMLEKTKRSSVFIAHLSKNALQLRPPLGFFRDFVLVQDGENKKVLDLKHNGIAPIVDLARIYALSEGISATNTIDRLKQVAGTRSLTKSSAANLIDAYEFLSMLRMQHQSKRMQSGKSPNNFLSPKDLSKLEREHLKDAFKVIKTMQDARQSAF